MMTAAHLMTSNLVSALLAYGATGQVCTTNSLFHKSQAALL